MSDQDFEEMRSALRLVVKNHTYQAPAGNTNCRFCDNDMDDEGTSEDMHDEDCVIHAVRKALKSAKAALQKSHSPQPNGYLENKDHPDDGPDRRGMGDW